MRIPSATYRLQFTPDFGFNQAKAIVEYLSDLGISAIYASPIFAARSGSQHGYDVVDQNRLNPELGTEEEYEALIEEVQKHGLGWVQDIVPNHMAFSQQNPYLMDALEAFHLSGFWQGWQMGLCSRVSVLWEVPHVSWQG